MEGAKNMPFFARESEAAGRLIAARMVRNLKLAGRYEDAAKLLTGTLPAAEVAILGDQAIKELETEGWIQCEA